MTGTCAYCGRDMWLRGLEPCCNQPSHAARLVCKDIPGCLEVVRQRIHDAPAMWLSDADVRTVLDALDEATESVLDKAELCGECSARPDGCQCPTCESRMARVAAYRALAERLGGLS